ncbi:hypothetical protein EZ449_04935 [Pedobacter frigidisoli]|uniref:Zinc-binding metallo-peptidase n=1 Tax=Pedobacter frigidisoli TaxID=2530455 RepID=A0A4R0P4R4_9SPHI|nr:hypothetical protein [Pedobacter frigidisoli]TCD11609.1 hypothetical protein EZ449_04935 [Pedobacter frigidisoli]
MKNRILIITIFLVMLLGCKKEETLQPSVTKIEYTLPQGSNAFDADIVTLFKNYNSYFLYKFNPAIDFAWVPAALGTDNLFSTKFSCEQADEAYVAKVLPFAKNNWLSFYPDTLLKRALPFKVLLAKNLKRLVNPNSADATLSNTGLTSNTLPNTILGYYHITISNNSANFDAMTAAQKVLFKGDLHIEFWNYMLNTGKVVMPPTFTTGSNYTLTVSASTMYVNGFLDTKAKAQTNPALYDLKTYIKAITNNSRATLDNTILKATNDTKGLVKQKYNIVINYYKTVHNIDLQAIGDATLVP